MGKVKERQMVARAAPLGNKAAIGKTSVRKKVAVARTVGRPTSYKPEFSQLAEDFSRLGLTDKLMAEAFGVAESTLNAWKLEFPEFSESIRAGKVVSDSVVASALFKRATGFKDVDGKRYPPDVGACQFWLKNRQSGQWREKIDIQADVSTDYPARADLDAIYAVAMEKRAAQNLEIAARKVQMGAALRGAK